MSSEIALRPVALTAENFSAFGDVIQTQDARHFEMNGGTLERYYDLANINIGADSGGRPVMSIAKCRRLTSLPHEITFLERHPHGSQAIYPLFNQTMLVVVAPLGNSISAHAVQAFYSNGRQGINFHPGVWHLPIIALQAAQNFMIIDRGGANQNCDEYLFEAGDQITLLAPPEH